MQSYAPGPNSGVPEALGQLKRLVWERPDLQAGIAGIEADGPFSEAVADIARANGLELDAEAVRRAAWPDPLGLSRWFEGPGDSDTHAWPGPEWLPMHLNARAAEPMVDWIHFAGRRLTEPFFEESVQRAISRPFNRLFRIRMPLSQFLAGADGQSEPAPSGLIFHMSRCGSTLVAQMLASIPANVVVSEASPLDGMVQLFAGQDTEAAAAGLRAMAAALCRRSESEGGGRFLKLDSWHALALPLFRRAFPVTPWVFLYRDPLEVMASQMSQRGLQTVHGAMDPRIFGIEGADTMPGEAYCAEVLERTCRAAAYGLSLGGGCLVNYRELPNALWSRILPHFGIQPDGEELALMQQAAGRNAKTPYEPFAPDGGAKRSGANAAVRDMTKRRLAPVYVELEALRLGAAETTA